MGLSDTQTLAVTAFLLTVGVGVLLASSAFLGHAASRLRAAGAEPQAQWWLLSLVAVWFGVALAVSAGDLISFTLVVPFVAFPIALGFALTFARPVRDLLAEIPTHWLVAVQAYRVAGGVFIYPYLTEGVLSRGFALNAGVGDVLTGLAAPLIAWLVLRRGAGARVPFLVWTTFGILDLVVAISSAAYFGFGAEGGRPQFPITSIPLFFGPPFGILIHLVTARNFALRFAPPLTAAERAV